MHSFNETEEVRTPWYCSYAYEEGIHSDTHFIDQCIPAALYLKSSGEY